MPGISVEADQKKAEAKQKEYEREYIRGTIYDRKGKAIAWTDEAGGKRQYLDGKAFSNFLGYQSKIYGNSGVERTMNQYLVHSASKESQKRGADLTLTIDADLQMKAYEKMKKMKGSVVVMDAKTGEILTLVSSPTYDLNTLEENWQEVNEKEGLLLSNAFRNPVAPGSVFKLVTSKAIIENHLEKEVVDDKGYLVVDGQKIRNYNGNEYGSIDFMEAFLHSSNVYFMDRGLKLGNKIMQEAGESFLLGQDISLDFTTLHSTFSLKNASKNVLAATSFGQGETLVTPLQMAMITQSIANNGVMMQPYLFTSAVNGKEKIVYEGEQKVLTETMNEKTAATLKKAMVEAGEYYEFTEDYGQIAAKTGTAQRGDGTNNAWLVTFAPADDPKYVIVANQLSTKEIGKSMMPVIESLYQSLLDEN
ncbi:MAG: penicillin-binding transpeptidase domain-containing protein [Eubacteriales bacterium]|nr:penicillin-binding transpeptidase domain-containing protein [Eubacteriales bacterium]